MHWLYTMLLLAVTFFLGLVIGESWAPISGITTQALAARCASLEARAEALGLRYEKLRALVTDIEHACHIDGDLFRDRRSAGKLR